MSKTTVNDNIYDFIYQTESMIQFDKGRVVDGKTSGQMFWPGWNASASGNMAADEKILNFNF